MGKWSNNSVGLLTFKINNFLQLKNMKNSTNNFTGFNIETLQNYFDFDFQELEESNEDELEYIEQSHFGDLLIEITEIENERYKLWRNLDCNGGGIEVEYCGAANGYRWETVYES